MVQERRRRTDTDLRRHDPLGPRCHDAEGLAIVIAHLATDTTTRRVAHYAVDLTQLCKVRETSERVREGVSERTCTERVFCGWRMIATRRSTRHRPSHTR